MSIVVDHYLLQLKSLLPRKQRDAVMAEIRSSIESAIRERELELGRKLDENEASDVLKRYGHPNAIAGRYLPMQQLIGPNVFPLYWYVLQAVLVVIAAVAGMVAATALFTDPNATRAVLEVLARFFWLAVEAAALVTFAFVLLDRFGGRSASDFDARRLGTGLLGARAPPLGEIPRHETVIDLATVAIFLLWWTDWVVFPSVTASVKVELGSTLRALFAPVIVLCVVDLARLVYDVAMPYRTRPRVSFAVAVNAAWLGLLALAFTAPDLLQAAPSIQEPAEIEHVVSTAERIFRIAIIGVGIWTASLLAADIRRLLQNR